MFAKVTPFCVKDFLFNIFKMFFICFKMQEAKSFEKNVQNYFRKFYDQQAISILADCFTFCWQGKRNLEALILSCIA